MRLALVGGLYVAVMILAAAFLSHRAVGPVARLAEELKEKIHKNVSIEHLHVRSGDDLEPLIEVLNQVLRKEKGNGKNE